MEKYSEYMDSGVEWLGEIPNHWDIVATKWIANLYTGDSLNEKQKERYSEFKLDSIPYISSKDISLQTEAVDYENGLYIPITEKKFKVARKNSLLLCIEGGSAGRKHAFLSKDVCFVNKLCCFDSKINSRYHYYFIQSFYFRSMFTRNIQGLIGGVSLSTIKNFYTLIPSLSEQKLIASYLDSQTSKIDEAIAQQQKMIDLLNERKQIIINNAVTKGLDSNVPMKDSGVDWIGMIPEHWKVKKLKHTAKTNSGSTPRIINGKDSPNSNIRWIRTTDLNNDLVTDSSEYLSEKEFKSASCPWLEKGTILISMYGGTGSFGKLGILAIEATINQAICSISCNGSVLSKYMFYYLQAIHPLWLKFAASSRKDPNLSQDIIRNISTLEPPLKEQELIVVNIETQIRGLNSKASDVQRMIELLQERKQIIINEVVTGKVKVS